MKMVYEEILIPIPLGISSPLQLPIGKSEIERARAFCKWFASDSNGRILVLARAVNTSAQYADWKPDYSAQSLLRLGPWFKGVAESRDLTPEEIGDRRILIKGAMGRFADSTAIPDKELTGRTYSIAADAGLYLAKAMMFRRPELRWKFVLNSKTSMDRLLPVLTGFRTKVTFSPINTAIGLAWGFINAEENLSAFKDVVEDYTAEKWGVLPPRGLQA